MAANRDTFEKASAKIQRLLLFDEMQEMRKDINGKIMEKRRFEVTVAICLFIAMLKMLVF